MPHSFPLFQAAVGAWKVAPGYFRRGITAFRLLVVKGIERLGPSRLFIVIVLMFTFVTNAISGEQAFVGKYLTATLGGPLLSEEGSGEPLPPELPPTDTVSAVTQPVPPSDTPDAFSFLADTVGGLVNPSNEPLEWVPEEAEVITYMVETGDTVSSIAQHYGISMESILWANGLTAGSVLQPGQELRFPSVSGILHKVSSGDNISNIAARYQVSPDRIIAANHLNDPEDIMPGAELIIPGGRRAITSGATAQRGVALNSTDTSGYFRPPTVGLNWGKLHYNNAVDIANACGTPVWASASGVVEWAGFDPGWYYGNYVIIRHPNGIQTYYTHLRAIFVSAGAAVTQGDLIGEIGNTGRTVGVTGCHLHFEVRGGRNPFIRYR